KKDEGVSTGKFDGLADLVVSKDVAQSIEVSGYGGVVLRGKPDGVSTPGALRWGIGAGFPSHRAIRITTEATGEVPFDDSVTVSQALTAIDNNVAPGSSPAHNLTAVTAGITWTARNGFFAGAGLTWNLPSRDRTLFNTDTNVGSSCLGSCPAGDFVDFQFRVGYHPGVP